MLEGVGSILDLPGLEADCNAAYNRRVVFPIGRDSRAYRGLPSFVTGGYWAYPRALLTQLLVAYFGPCFPEHFPQVLHRPSR